MCRSRLGCAGHTPPRGPGWRRARPRRARSRRLSCRPRASRAPQSSRQSYRGSRPCQSCFALSPRPVQQGARGIRQMWVQKGAVVRAGAHTISMVSSSTRFMNWSKPRNVPWTVLLPLSLTASAATRVHRVSRGARCAEVDGVKKKDICGPASCVRCGRGHALCSLLSMYLCTTREDSGKGSHQHVANVFGTGCGSCIAVVGARSRAVGAHFFKSGPVADGMLLLSARRRGC